MDKLSPNLQKISVLSNKKVRVLVYTRDNRLRSSNGFEVIKEYPFIHAVGLETEAGRLEELAKLPFVRYVHENAAVMTFDDFNFEETAEAFGYTGTLTGKGVTLCVLDTGLSPHVDFCLPLNRIKDFRDFIQGKEYPYDDNGHGTFVAGVAVGGGIASGKKFSGVAPRADIVSVKVIGGEGEGGAFGVLDGMQWLLDNRKRLDVKVCCMSFGSNPTDVNDPLRRGAEILVRNGIAVVAASGNSGLNNLKSPAISPEVISVGAVDCENRVAEFTSRGYVGGRQKPEIYADGVDVVSTLAGATYGTMSGTSVAAPYVAGACCLLLEKYPACPPRRLKDMLLQSSAVNAEGKFVLRLN